MAEGSEAGHHADGGVRVYTGNKLKDEAPSPTESNADIKVYGAWKEGVWTLEMGRALDTKANAVRRDKKIDVVFDSSKVYFFGVSVFDNTEAANHAFAGGPIALVFK